MIPIVPSSHPRRLAVIAQCLLDALIGSLVALPFGIPVSIEENALKHHDSELVDVWQFDSTPRNHSALRTWGARQADLNAFRIDLLVTNQIVLRYVHKGSRATIVPDWKALGYANPRLLSSDAMPVQDTDLPRSAVGWSCALAGSLATIAVLRRRLRGIWDPDVVSRMPPIKSWKLTACVILLTVAIQVAGNRLLNVDATPVTSAQRVIARLSGLPWWLALATITVAGPMVEEALFRGCFFGRFRRHGYVVFGMVFSSFAFAAAHRVPLLMPQYFLKGLMLAWLSHRTESLWPAVAVHVAWNIVAVMFA